MDPLMSPFFQVFDPATNTFRYWGEGTEPWEGTSYENAAEFTTAVATDPSAVGIQKFLGDRKNIKEIASIFEEVYGVKPELKRLGSLEDLRTTMHQLRAEHPNDVFKYMSLFFMYYWINGQTFVGPEVDDAKYPDAEPVTWKDFMKTRSIQELAAAYFSLA
ncbi:NmrA-like family protein [Colletotrichum tofieldiae]|nr:NmrA-like family protein [Colletotrichum tofieldiae]GKT79409.1 NmrA-like family protein [Colletotrichum tofieldiae]